MRSEESGNHPVFIGYFQTPVGELILGDYRESLCLCDWRYRKMRPSIDKRIGSLLQADFQTGETPLLGLARRQLEEYFSSERTDFSIPLLPCGTDFQQKVWSVLQTISYGKTISYQALAREIGQENAVRAVASANGANALSIFIPCHRVVGNKGELTGYAGGLRAKRKLLEWEGALPLTLFPFE